MTTLEHRAALVLALERQVWDAFVRGDDEADRCLLSEDFLGVYAVGRAGREVHAAQLEPGPTVATYSLSDPHVMELAPGALLLSYRAEFTVRGDSKAFRMLVTSIWQQRNGEWLNVFRQDTEGTAYGDQAL